LLPQLQLNITKDLHLHIQYYKTKIEMALSLALGDNSMLSNTSSNTNFNKNINFKTNKQILKKIGVTQGGQIIIIIIITWWLTKIFSYIVVLPLFYSKQSCYK